MHRETGQGITTLIECFAMKGNQVTEHGVSRRSFLTTDKMLAGSAIAHPLSWLGKSKRPMLTTWHLIDVIRWAHGGYAGRGALCGTLIGTGCILVWLSQTPKLPRP